MATLERQGFEGWKVAKWLGKMGICGFIFLFLSPNKFQ